MSGAAALAYALLVLILPISALLARRLPARQWLPMAGAWIAIFLAGYAILVYLT